MAHHSPFGRESAGALSRNGSATSQCAGTGADARWYFGPTVQPARRTVQTSEVDATVKRRINARLRILQPVLPPDLQEAALGNLPAQERVFAAFPFRCRS